MAVQTQIFDLYYIFVELIFNSILASWIGLLIIFAIIGFLMRMSPLTIFFILGIFSLVFGIGYIGAAAAIPIFIASFIYFSFNLVQSWRRFG